MLGRSNNGLGQGFGRGAALAPEKPTLPPLIAVVISPKASVCSVCSALERNCVPFVQHCLISLLPTLPHSMILFHDSTPFFL